MAQERTFGGISQKYAAYETADILLSSIPYDGTSTWGKGADKGFDSFLEAAENMELYDIETDSEVYKNGISILPDAPDFTSPEEMFQFTYNHALQLLKEEKFLTFFGGEHSISIGIIKAFYEKYKDLTVLQIDAHADLRPSYNGTKYNHACAVYNASKNCNLVQYGIRSMDIKEKEHVQNGNCFYSHDILAGDIQFMDVISKMSDTVYITLDVDAFDSSVMPATGTPEPGGLDWHTVTGLLQETFKKKNVVGFDIVELAPIENLHHPQFLVAKLYYKMLSYQFAYHGYR